MKQPFNNRYIKYIKRALIINLEDLKEETEDQRKQ